jgi:ubiquinone/menaquinone biosynthesis C-methylase UbiE
MSMTREEYYQQWTQMPRPASEWQTNEYELNHKGRKAASDYITGGSILEVACGIGVDYPLYKAKGISYFGVDITPKFIEEAQRRGVPCQVADALKLPFPDRSFDAVYSKDFLLHLPPGDWRKALAEMARVARDKILIVDHGWENKTRYLLAEQYKSTEGKELLFFNNVYKKVDVEEYMASLGFDLEVSQVVSLCTSFDHLQLDTLTVFVRRK